MLDVQKIRRDFPILERKVNGKPLVYLDNAATSQKPQQVIEAMVDYYQQHNANVHRGIHTLGDESTRMYQQARKKIAKFIGAGDANELVFVRNTTEGINLVAYSWGTANVSKGDVIVTTEMEHHSNLVPWQELAKRTGARVEYADIDDLDKKLILKPKLLALVHVSNFLGTINPIREIIESIKVSKHKSIKILVDGAQAVPQMPVNVSELGCDFYAFSGHKMYGPMGIGGLWVRREILEDMQPFMTGGGMISEVHKTGTVFADLPDRFDAGTPNVAGAVGLAAAVEYLEKIGMDQVREHEKNLMSQVIRRLRELSFIKIYGPTDPDKRGGLVAFTLRLRSGHFVHAHDVAQVLDSEGIAVRSGHHCTMPMHEKLGISGTTRASFGIYNTKEDVDRLIEGLGKVREIFHG